MQRRGESRVTRAVIRTAKQEEKPFECKWIFTAGKVVSWMRNK